MRLAICVRWPRGVGTIIKKIAATTENTGLSHKQLPKRNWRLLKYFYANGKLHKLIQQNRGTDSAVAWCYEDKCRYRFSRSDLKANAGKAYTIREAAELMGKTYLYIYFCLTNGKLKVPQRTYTLDGRYKPGKYFLSQQDILDMHEYFSTVHRGRPRHDELITAAPMPSKAELLAMMRNDTAIYVKENGEFIPIWKHDW